VLTPGDRGPQVQALQRSLVSLGYAPGAIDGIYGPKTEHALEAFQTRSKLTADGILGPETLDALKKALRRPRPSSSHGSAA
jgi:peptidoglycan DL-endopeptidase CwlO